MHEIHNVLCETAFRCPLGKGARPAHNPLALCLSPHPRNRKMLGVSLCVFEGYKNIDSRIAYVQMIYKGVI